VTLYNDIINFVFTTDDTTTVIYQ